MANVSYEVLHLAPSSSWSTDPEGSACPLTIAMYVLSTFRSLFRVPKPEAASL